jgi:hypothetical protein
MLILLFHFFLKQLFFYYFTFSFLLLSCRCFFILFYLFHALVVYQENNFALFIYQWRVIMLRGDGKLGSKWLARRFKWYLEFLSKNFNFEKSVGNSHVIKTLSHDRCFQKLPNSLTIPHPRHFNEEFFYYIFSLQLF